MQVYTDVYTFQSLTNAMSEIYIENSFYLATTHLLNRKDNILTPFCRRINY